MIVCLHYHWIDWIRWVSRITIWSQCVFYWPKVSNFGKYARLTVCYLSKFLILASISAWWFACLCVCLSVTSSIQVTVFLYILTKLNPSMYISRDLAGNQQSWNTVLGIFWGAFFTPKVGSLKLHIFFNLPVLIVLLSGKSRHAVG